MGDVRRYKCQCGYEKQLMIGGGRNSQNLKIICKDIPEDIFSEFMRKKFAKTVLEYGIVNSAISCPECEELFVVSEFSYTLSDAEVRYVTACPNCGEEHTPIEDSDLILCPKCNKQMTYSVEGLWD